MRILQINAVYGHGSTGVIVEDIYHLCKEKNLDCFVASPDSSVLSCETGYKIGNVCDQKLHAILSRVAGKQAYFSTCSTKKLIQYIDSIAPDIIHLHNVHSNFLNLNLLLEHLSERNVSVVLTLHDCWFYTGGCFHYTSSQCYRWQDECGECPRRYSDTPAIFRDASHDILKDKETAYKRLSSLTITGVSKWISEEAKKSILGEFPIVTIGNAVDTNLFCNRPSTLKRDLGLEDKFVILGPASKWLLQRNKDFLFAFCSKMKSDEILLLYGATTVPDNLPHNVKTCGFIRDRKELVLLYSGADVFANVSHEDSFSLINIESQACGTPVVTFACTGLTDTVDNQCGFTVPEDNVDEMYEKIQFLRCSDLSRFSKQCRQYIIETHEKEIVYKSYIELYDELYNQYCR